MKEQELAPTEKVESLKIELAEYYANNTFLSCNTMGEIVQQSLAVVV
jgi:hypothetical protein